MKSKKSKSSKKEKKSRRVLPEKLSLEKEAEKNLESVEDKKEISSEFMEELDANGIISSMELNQILKSQMKLNKLENLPVGASLEGGLMFAPRMKERKEAEGKIYSNRNYDPKYTENQTRYSEKTPGAYEEKTATSGKESPKGSDDTGNGNP